MTVAALSDGREVVLRPLHTEDEALLEAAFARMSPDSRYRRFLTPKNELTQREAHYMCSIDHRDHEAYCALDPETGDLVAEARFIRCVDRPRAAEFAITVADGWQHRGLGTLLLEALVTRAREEGIDRFQILTLGSNHEMAHLLHHLGPVCVLGWESGAMHAEARIDRPCQYELPPEERIVPAGAPATPTS